MYTDVQYNVRGDQPDTGLYGSLSFPLSRRPWIKTDRDAGPLLWFSDGQAHWLTRRERFLVFIRWHNAETLQVKLRPRLAGFLAGRRRLAGVDEA
jgi:hypothetical protein